MLTDPTSRSTKTTNPAGSLLQGCYLLEYFPRTSAWDGEAPSYIGTMRLVLTENAVRGSGDLYANYSVDPPPIKPQVPIFPRQNYAMYLVLTSIQEDVSDATITLELETFWFDGPSLSWKREGDFSAVLKRVQPDHDVPNRWGAFAGDVFDASGKHNGEIQLTWLTAKLRRAVVEIGAVDGVAPPMYIEYERSWSSIFAEVGWDVQVVPSDLPLVAGTDSWSESALYQAMRILHETKIADDEWRYYLLCVSKIDWYGRGVMFDFQGTDAQRSFLELATIAAGAVFDHNGPWPVALKNTVLSQNPLLYFRTAVHEIGHAMNLEHNPAANGFMNTTDAIMRSLQKENQAVGLDLLKFAPDDVERLQHLPDIIVRPGTPIEPRNLPTVSVAVFQDRSNISGDALKAKGAYTLTVEVLETEVPIGAPVRINLKLKHSGEPTFLPRLNMKSGNISGTIWGPDGNARSYYPLVHCLDGQDTEPNVVEISGSLTLLRGPQGHLFPLTGRYTIEVAVSWFIDKYEITLGDEVEVVVTPPVDRAHEKAARRVIDTEDSLLAFALGLDYLAEANQAINAALANPVLAPYYDIIRLKRLIKNFGTERGSLARFVMLWTKPAYSPKLSEAEADGLGELVLSVLFKADTIRPEISEEIAHVRSLLLAGQVTGAQVRTVLEQLVAGISDEELLEGRRLVLQRNFKEAVAKVKAKLKTGAFTDKQIERFLRDVSLMQISDPAYGEFAKLVANLPVPGSSAAGTPVASVPKPGASDLGDIANQLAGLLNGLGIRPAAFQQALYALQERNLLVNQLDELAQIFDPANTKWNEQLRHLKELFDAAAQEKNLSASSQGSVSGAAGPPSSAVTFATMEPVPSRNGDETGDAHAPRPADPGLVSG